MADFSELTEFLADQLELPVRGRTYKVPAVDWETGLVCQALWNTALAAQVGSAIQQRDRVIIDDNAEQDLVFRCLGPVLDELKAEGVPYPLIRHMGLTIFYWTVVGEPAALRFWEGGPGKAPPRTKAPST